VGGRGGRERRRGQGQAEGHWWQEIPLCRSKREQRWPWVARNTLHSRFERQRGREANLPRHGHWPSQNPDKEGVSPPRCCQVQTKWTRGGSPPPHCCQVQTKWMRRGRTLLVVAESERNGRGGEPSSLLLSPNETDEEGLLPPCCCRVQTKWTRRGRTLLVVTESKPKNKKGGDPSSLSLLPVVVCWHLCCRCHRRRRRWSWW